MSHASEERRLRALRSTLLLDSPPEPAFDRLTRMASLVTRAPLAAVSLLDEGRQFFKSTCCTGELWASRRDTPLSHSLCRHAIRDRAPLVVIDAREHPLWRDDPAVRAREILSYAGAPLHFEGEAIGVLCAMDGEPRAWPPEEIGALQDLADSVVSEIALRAALRSARSALQEVHHRVKNNLQIISSLLSLQARHLRAPEVRAAFAAAQGRIQSIAALHESLHHASDLDRLDMKEYCDRLVMILRQAPGPRRRARITTAVEPIFLPLDVAIPCGLIIHELLTNALERAPSSDADPGGDEIRLEVRREAGQVVLCVSNNGSWPLPVAAPEEEPSLSLTLVQTLSRQLGGVIDFHGGRDAGCTLHFPSGEERRAER